ncbi:type II toxin-antitoxin system HicA family toxin [Larkinella sp. GY13]|uniref:type II toxin-antitoxin system HicA family toxin n=1 Tax=Larkinella sp. GY13 TaxID=3453720 RepID=UPI003EEE94ED
MKASDLIKLIEEKGWYEDRRKGSHRIFKHPDIKGHISIPDHGKKDLKPGILNDLLKQAKLK